MALIEIRAEFRCDSCRRTFSVAIDPAPPVPEGWSMFEKAEDALRGSLDYKGPYDDNGTLGATSFQNDMHLCGPCTHEADLSTPNEEPRS